VRPADAQRLLRALAGVDAPVGFAVFDGNHRFVAVNDVLAGRFGRSIADHLGRRPREVLEAGLASHIHEVIDLVLRTGESVEIDEPLLMTPDLSTEKVRSSWYVIDEGHGREVAMFVIDDKSQQRAVSALRHSRARNVRLLEVAGELAQAVTVAEVEQAVDAVGRRTVRANRSGIESLGRSSRYWPDGVETPVFEVGRTGWPIFIHNREQAVTNYPEGAFAQFIEGNGDHSWAVLPLHGSSGGLGVLWFAFGVDQVFEPETCRFLRAVAQQCAVALERAVAFERERTVADTLTVGLRPPRLPVLAGVEFSAYGSGGSSHAVGGDWYDAILLPGGDVAIAVGDVMGHGIAAASGMGQLRSALRALALADAAPAEVLTGLDRLVERDESIELATVIYAVLDPSTGHMRLGDAGHLPLVRVPTSGKSELIDAGTGTTPIGVTEPRYGRDLQLAPGDTIVVFTDGLVESRRRSLEYGVGALIRSLETHRRETLDEMLGAVVAELGVSSSTDDVTILALRWR
jgi:PAS domain-containing protein